MNLYHGTGANSAITRDWNAGHFKCILEPISIPNSLAKDEDGDLVNIVTRVLVDVEHYNFHPSGTIPTAGTANSHHTNFNSPSGSNGHYTQWAAWVGTNASYVYTGGHSFPVNPEWQISRHSSYNNITGDGLGDGIDGTILDNFNTPTKYDSVNIGIPQHLHQATGGGTNITTNDGYDSIFGVDTTINDAFIVQTILLEGISDKDYYANVKGRINTFVRFRNCTIC